MAGNIDNIKESIDKLSLKDMKEVYSHLQYSIEKRRKQEKVNAIKTMRKMAEETGLDFDDLMREHFGIDNNDGRKGKLPDKYIHPDDPEKTWSGRGRMPAWMTDYIERHDSYNDKEDFLIHQEEKEPSAQ
ncbi:H-NS histone family protein [Roseovarius atlanticus]|uniref:H-NS histone family protein n=1 Tax=Roseovarius atlanticus TaxID=1641875 RepID=UPI000708CFC3|nr:H-NS histone family protein [Roseovarius atlanticus]